MAESTGRDERRECDRAVLQKRFLKGEVVRDKELNLETGVRKKTKEV